MLYNITCEFTESGQQMNNYNGWSSTSFYTWEKDWSTAVDWPCLLPVSECCTQHSMLRSPGAVQTLRASPFQQIEIGLCDTIPTYQAYVVPFMATTGLSWHRDWSPAASFSPDQFLATSPSSKTGHRPHSPLVSQRSRVVEHRKTRRHVYSL